ncbi:MAG: SGNH/GDSL hydrolase family protein [Planctomycetota bacterium]
MKATNLLLSLLLAAPAWAVQTAIEAPAAQRALRTRIMCAGDSNTHGVNGATSYRYPLWFALTPIHSRVRFVGSRNAVWGENGTTVPDLGQYNRYYTYFDRDHEGYNGFKTTDVLPWMPLAASQTRPDLVLLMIGTNDIGQMGGGGVNHAKDGITQLVDAIRHQAPATTFVLATLPPIGPGTSYFFSAAHIDTFNAQLPALVASLDTPGSRVLFADVNSALSLATDMQPDGLHANAGGEAKIAGVFLPHVLATIRGQYRPAPQPAVILSEPSFEGAGLPDGSFSSNEPAGWLFPLQNNVLAGIWNPGGASYTGAAGAGVIANTDGTHILAIENSGGTTEMGWVYQQLPTTVSLDTSYTLDLSVGRRLGSSPRPPSFGGYEVQLLAGNRVIASEVDLAAPGPGTFAPISLQILADQIDADWVGAPLAVRMRTTSAASASATDFDQVVLTAW